MSTDGYIVVHSRAYIELMSYSLSRPTTIHLSIASLFVQAEGKYVYDF